MPRCEACNVAVPSAGMEVHVRGKRHRKNTNVVPIQKPVPIPKPTPSVGGGVRVRCDVCDVVVTSMSCMPMHVQGRRHQEMTEVIPKKAASATALQAMPSGGKVRCDVCNVKVTSALSMLEHIQGKKHQRLSKTVSKRKNRAGTFTHGTGN